MSDLINFVLDGKPVALAKGKTVMQAAEKEGVDIPHFCWHEGLSIAGCCRFCMVEIEGVPKLEIACNLQPREGMVVSTKTAKVKEAQKWALEYHLVNHPLDCPVCDQAGECGLQDYYMSVGKYESQMDRDKVLKPKAVDIGDRLILDMERCILCSRCVRFEDEVTKTGSLGIFDRGDRAIIGTYGEEKITHNYQENIVDICPVGAFTSKPFRFKQRVWFLKEKESICPGCSTGCHIEVHGKPEVQKYFRVKPVHSDVNGHWMCDKGRDVYEHANPENRLRHAWHQGKSAYDVSTIDDEVQHLVTKLLATKPEKIGVLVSAQQTNEEYASLLKFFTRTVGTKNIYQWRQADEKRDAFDGILWRGDHNANTAGLKASLEQAGLSGTVQNQLAACLAANLEVLIVVPPEVPFTFTGLAADLQALARKDRVWTSAWTSNGNLAEISGFAQLMPTKVFCEKTGHFTNFAGKLGALNDAFPTLSSQILDVHELVGRLQATWEA